MHNKVMIMLISCVILGYLTYVLMAYEILLFYILQYGALLSQLQYYYPYQCDMKPEPAYLVY